MTTASGSTEGNVSVSESEESSSRTDIWAAGVRLNKIRCRFLFWLRACESLGSCWGGMGRLFSADVEVLPLTMDSSARRWSEGLFLFNFAKNAGLLSE